jgi:hypothetical protein
MSRATVVEAQKTLERFGFLSIQRRRKRVQGMLGVKIVQDTNAYTLSLARSLGALALAAFGNKPQTAAGKPAGPEFTRPPAIKDEILTPMPPPQDWLPEQEYRPLLT